MTLLLGTLDGLYRAPGIEFDQIEKVLDGRFSTAYSAATDTLLARADGDVYESDDAGRTWSEIPTPDHAISAVALAPDGNRLYVGVQSQPVTLQVSTDWGATWEQLGTFPELPELTHYVPQNDAMMETPQQVGISRLCVVPTLSERLVVGLDPAGVYVSEDGGETWIDRSCGLSDDVHDSVMLTPTQYLAACWWGVYLTGNAGRTWAQLVTKQGLLKYTYFPSVAVHQGSIYTAAAAGPPGEWGGDLAIKGKPASEQD